MQKKKGGLGRGFETLFDDNTADTLADETKIVSLRVGDIEPNVNQPRKSFDDDALDELAASIKEHGILQPLIVRPKIDGSYQIVAGERRYRAARKIGLTEVPVVVRAYTDEEVAVIALIENLQREDLDPIEQAQGISELINRYSFTQEQASQKLGKSRSAITNTLRLMSLPESVRDLVKDSFLSAGHARTLLGLDDKSKIEETAEEIINKKMSVREAEKLVRVKNEENNKPSKNKKTRNIFYDETELALKESLGRRVKVKNGKKGGFVEIEYFDDEDLKYLAKMMED